MNEAGCCCCPHAALVVWYRYPYLRRFIPIFAGEVLCQFSTVTRLICCILYIILRSVSYPYRRRVHFRWRSWILLWTAQPASPLHGHFVNGPLAVADSLLAGLSLVRAPVLSAASPLACPVSTHVADASVPFCSFSF